MSVMDFVVSLPVVAEVSQTSEVGTRMRRGYVVPMRWMVIYEYGVPGGALNLNSTNYPDHGQHGDPPLSRKNLHGRAGNRTSDLMISSQKHRQLDHEAGRNVNVLSVFFSWYFKNLFLVGNIIFFPQYFSSSLPILSVRTEASSFQQITELVSALQN
jgi:hypothetical protein